jgi:hypothetical protein
MSVESFRKARPQALVRALCSGLPIVLAAATAGVLGTLTSAALAARVETGGLVVVANGSITPKALPKRSFAPIKVEGDIKISARNSLPPPALRSVTVEFDRDGHLDTQGLPTCAPSRIRKAPVALARRRCKSAIVGTGSVGGVISYPGVPALSGEVPLTVFNGPRIGGKPSMVFHSQTPTFPTPTVYVVTATIERIANGQFGYRLSASIPEIAEGHGVVTKIKVSIRRLFTHHGRTRSYVSARCADGFLEARGSLGFSNQMAISGPISVPCTVGE